MLFYFPFALLVLKADEIDISNFEQISLLTRAHMSFYYPRKVAKSQPCKFDADLIAIDAFNVSKNSDNRDVGPVFYAHNAQTQAKKA